MKIKGIKGSSQYFSISLLTGYAASPLVITTLELACQHSCTRYEVLI